MQTVAKLAHQAFKWESVKLANGAYRIQNACRLAEVPNLTEFIDCTENAQFADELACVRDLFQVETNGFWIGLMKESDHHSEVISLLLPAL